MKKNFLFACLFLLSSVLVSASTIQNGTSIKKKNAVEHVVLIGIDGWGAYSLLKAHDIPNIRFFMDNGCYTLKDRSVLPSSSAINWASMFMGVPTEIHGYTSWNSQKPDIPALKTNKNGIFPTIFSVIREQIPTAETGCFAEWDGIKHLVDSLSISRVAQAKDYENNPMQLCEMASEYIKGEKPKFVAVCFDQLDHTGHSLGHDTPNYYETLASIDNQIGVIVQSIKDAGMWDNTIFVLTADHGGISKTHGGKSLREMEIPFIIYGKGIKKGGKITDVMMQYDCAATIAEALGLQRPICWRGVPAYSAFER